MTISYQAATTAAVNNATSAAVGFPSGIQAGDLLLLVATAKYSAYTSAPPTDFIFLEELVGGSGGTGIDAGNVRTAVWYKIATGSESGSVNVTKATETGSVILARMFLYRRTAGYGWNILTTDGSSSSGTTAWSAAGANNIFIAAGDVVVCATGANTDGSTYSSHSLTATGCTFSAAQERQDSGTNTGHDVGLLVTEHTCATGTSSTAPTFATTASTGTPDGTTVFVRLREAKGIAADQGSYAWNAQAATNVGAQRKLTAEQGAYALTGYDMLFPAGEPRAWAPGAWGSVAWMGTSWYGQGAVNYTLTWDKFDYTLGGQDVGLLAARKLAADQGSYALGGQDAGLAKGYKLLAEQGSHTATAQEFASSRTYAIAADYGSYALTLQEGVFQSGATVGRAWTTDAWYSGAWYGTVWADNAAAPNHYLMVAEAGHHQIGALADTQAWSSDAWANDAWVGTAWQGGESQTGLYAGRLLTAEQGSYLYTGDDPVLRDILTVPESGSYALTGQDAALFKGYVMSAGVGNYALTGRAVTWLKGYHIDAQFGICSTQGYDAEFQVGVGALFGAGQYTLTGQAAGLTAQRSLTAEFGSFALTGQAAKLIFGDVIIADHGDYTLTGFDVTFRRGYRLTAETGRYVAGGQVSGQIITPTRRGGGAIVQKKRGPRVLVEDDETQENLAKIIDDALSPIQPMLKGRPLAEVLKDQLDVTDADDTIGDDEDEDLLLLT